METMNIALPESMKAFVQEYPSVNGTRTSNLESAWRWECGGGMIGLKGRVLPRRFGRPFRSDVGDSSDSGMPAPGSFTESASMDLLTHQEFESFVADLGLAFRKPRRPKSLEYRPGRGAMYSWAVPAGSHECLALVNRALDGLAPWSSCVLWPFAGQWPGNVDLPGVGSDSTTWPLFLRWAGIPDGWKGAVRMRPDQVDVVKAVAFTFAAFGSSSQDDLFLFPNHGQQFIHFDPWNADPRDEELALPAIKVHFATPALAEQFTRHMARASFGRLLPAESFSEGGAEPGAGADSGRDSDFS